LIMSASNSLRGNAPIPSRPFSDCSITSTPAGRSSPPASGYRSQIDVVAVAQLARRASPSVHGFMPMRRARCSIRFSNWPDQPVDIDPGV
jgi:hypothetical protein